MGKKRSVSPAPYSPLQTRDRGPGRRSNWPTVTWLDSWDVSTGQSSGLWVQVTCHIFMIVDESLPLALALISLTLISQFCWTRHTHSVGHMAASRKTTWRLHGKVILCNIPSAWPLLFLWKESNCNPPLTSCRRPHMCSPNESVPFSSLVVCLPLLMPLSPCYRLNCVLPKIHRLIS